jgi:hypothetical protein
MGNCRNVMAHATKNSGNPILGVFVKQKSHSLGNYDALEDLALGTL